MTEDLGYVDIEWTDPGPAALDTTSYGIDDIMITGVKVNSVTPMPGGVARYWYATDGDHLPAGTITVAGAAGAVADLAGNSSIAFTNSFELDRGIVDVTDLVNIRFYGLQFNPFTKIYHYYVEVTNISDTPMNWPARLLIEDLIPDVAEVIEPHGWMDDGTPYFDLPSSDANQVLDPGELTGELQIAIYAPPRTPYTMNPRVLAGMSSETLAAANVWLEFGDAPAPLPTKIIDDGARHLPGGPQLGATRDFESDGADTAAADEDGVTFQPIVAGDDSGRVTIDLQDADSARVDAWVDFNRDGTWDPSEKILDNIAVDRGIETFDFQVPVDLQPGVVHARTRVSSAGNLDPTGFAYDGEVEDAAIAIEHRPPMVESVVINDGQSQRSSIRSVAVTFSTVVQIDSAIGDAFHFVKLDSGQSVVGNPDVQVIDGKTVVTFTFAPVTPLPDNSGLVDGNYQLRIIAEAITANGLTLDGNGDGLMGDDHTFGDDAVDWFYRQYGDINGDGTVDLFDFAAFRSAFGKTDGDEGFAAVPRLQRRWPDRLVRLCKLPQ